MKPWQDLTHYAGFDWAKDKHLIVIVDREGQIVADFEFEHSAQGWKTFDETTSAWPHLAVAIETSQGAVVNQLQQALLEYFPAALEAFDDWAAPSCWEFVLAFPTPQALATAGKRRWEKFLHTHRLWRPETVEKRLAIFAQADQFKASPAIVQAKSQLAITLCKVLMTLGKQLALYRKQIEELFQNHPDHGLFGSLPGARKILAPRLLAAVGSDPVRYGSQEVLQSIAGTAPISYASGKLHRVHVRWSCDKFLRCTVHLWADCFRHASAWGQTYYRHKRQQGMSHACALRCLGYRLLKIVFRMISDKKPYDAELHALNQQKHGSWVLKLAT